MATTKDFGNQVYILAGKIYGPGEVTFEGDVPEVMEDISAMFESENVEDIPEDPLDYPPVPDRLPPPLP